LILEICGKYNEQLRYREAIALYNRAAALRPEDPEIRRQRAPRFLNTLQFEKAETDFAFCEAARPGTLDIAYRLGLSCYMAGRRDDAADWFSRAREYAVARNDPEMEAAALYWQTLAVAGTRGTFGSWLKFDFTRSIDHHWAYRDAIRLFCAAFGPGGICEGGLAACCTCGFLHRQRRKNPDYPACCEPSVRRSLQGKKPPDRRFFGIPYAKRNKLLEDEPGLNEPEQIQTASILSGSRKTLLEAAADLFRPPVPADDEERIMGGTIINYGVYRFYRYLGEKNRADETLRIILENDGFWPCYAYLAAWTDRAGEGYW
jgi:tetratricopeptide (TPR) repeat protein